MGTYEQQAELEEEMVGMGTKRFWDRYHKLVEGAHLSETDAGVMVLKAKVEPLAAAIRTFIAECETGKPGRRHKAYHYLRQVADARVAAYIILKRLIDCAALHGEDGNLQAVAKSIGRSLEDEARLSLFAQHKKHLYNKIVKDQDEREIHGIRKRNALVRMMDRAAIRDENPALNWESWPYSEVLHLGMKCVDLAMTAIPDLLTVETVRRKDEIMKYCTLSEATRKWLENRNMVSEMLSPSLMPCVIPPKPWTNPFSGGYHTDEIRAYTLVKTSNRNYLNELIQNPMPKVYAAVNAVQATPWRINTMVLTVMQQIWEQGIEVDGLASGVEIPRPPKPVDIKTNQKARNEWKIEVGIAHRAERKRVSKRIQGSKILWMAEKFAKEPEIYFPHNLDFRGRMYAMPSHLNPQGADIAKGLLEFADGKPLGTSGMRWLKIHLANTYGEDKCSLDARVQWAETHATMIERVAADPLLHRDWIEADKPFQFLAACMEYAQAAQNPEHVSHLPISVDGSCNGLQNFSAMLRDEVGGAAVNLVPSEKPQDIYQIVADKLAERFAQSDNPYAAQWLAYGFTRKETKRSVMILPYAGTQSSMREYVMDRVKERCEAGDVPPWGITHLPAVAFFVKDMWDVLHTTVVAAMSAMHWLKQAAKVAAHDQVPVTWTTPLNFPALQMYPEMESRRVSTRLGGSIVCFRTNEPKVTDSNTVLLDRQRQASAVAPNFVHSMDAANLMLCVVRCTEKGIRHFSMVHDSYGTLAADMDTLSETLRESFIELYQTDVLADFEASVRAAVTDEAASQLPARPPMGMLDLAAVRNSLYFFA